MTSVEYDLDCCRLAKEKIGLTYDNESITSLPYENGVYDIVTAFDVVEHVEDHYLAVNELIRVTKIGGFIYTTVPAYMFLWSNHDVVNMHVRRYTMKSYSKLWQSHKENVSLVYKTYFNFFLFPQLQFLDLLLNYFQEEHLEKVQVLILLFMNQVS